MVAPGCLVWSVASARRRESTWIAISGHRAHEGLRREVHEQRRRLRRGEPRFEKAQGVCWSEIGHVSVVPGDGRRRADLGFEARVAAGLERIPLLVLADPEVGQRA